MLMVPPLYPPTDLIVTFQIIPLAMLMLDIFMPALTPQVLNMESMLMLLPQVMLDIL